MEEPRPVRLAIRLHFGLGAPHQARIATSTTRNSPRLNGLGRLPLRFIAAGELGESTSHENKKSLKTTEPEFVLHDPASLALAYLIKLVDAQIVCAG